MGTVRPKRFNSGWEQPTRSLVQRAKQIQLYRYVRRAKFLEHHHSSLIRSSQIIEFFFPISLIARWNKSRIADLNRSGSSLITGGQRREHRCLFDDLFSPWSFYLNNEICFHGTFFIWSSFFFDGCLLDPLILLSIELFLINFLVNWCDLELFLGLSLSFGKKFLLMFAFNR